MIHEAPGPLRRTVERCENSRERPYSHLAIHLWAGAASASQRYLWCTWTLAINLVYFFFNASGLARQLATTGNGGRSGGVDECYPVLPTSN